MYHHYHHQQQHPQQDTMKYGNPTPYQASLPVVMKKKTRGEEIASDLQNKITVFILESCIMEDGKLRLLAVYVRLRWQIVLPTMMEIPCLFQQ
jgi:hypothetical protein